MVCVYGVGDELDAGRRGTAGGTVLTRRLWFDQDVWNVWGMISAEWGAFLFRCTPTFPLSHMPPPPLPQTVAVLQCMQRLASSHDMAGRRIGAMGRGR